MNDYTISGDTCRPGISWSAVLFGALTGLGLGFLLQLFGIAIGLSAYNTSAGATTMAIGGCLGLLIGVVASMGAAGFVSGYLGRFHYPHCHGGVIYGFATWSIALILAAVVALPLTHYVSAYQRVLAPKVVISDSMPNNVDISTDSQTAASSTKNNESQATTVRLSPEALTGASWIIFILFFVGALSSCIGACYGMQCRKDCVVVDREPDRI